MNLFKKFLAPKEVKAALAVSEEVSFTYNCQEFEVIRKKLDELMLHQQDLLVKQIREGRTPRQCVYTVLSNIIGRELASGQHHIYRGVLSPMGPGPKLLTIFNSVIDELVNLGLEDEEGGKEVKRRIQQDIASVG